MLVMASSWEADTPFEAEKALNYVYHFFHGVVVPCMRPWYWRYCFPPTWIVPYIWDLRDYYTKAPYAKEREYLLEAN